MKATYGAVLVIAALAVVPAAAQKEQTWKGAISDSNCNAKHPAGEHEGKKMTDTDCTNVCVKKGAKFVFVSDGKVYQLENQSSKTIAAHAGTPGRADRDSQGRHHQRHEDQHAGQVSKGLGSLSAGPTPVLRFLS